MRQELHIEEQAQELEKLKQELTAQNIWRDALLDGWSAYAHIRQTGSSAGRRDVYFVHPSGKKFSSRPEVVRFLSDQRNIMMSMAAGYEGTARMGEPSHIPLPIPTPLTLSTFGYKSEPGLVWGQDAAWPAAQKRSAMESAWPTSGNQIKKQRTDSKAARTRDDWAEEPSPSHSGSADADADPVDRLVRKTVAQIFSRVIKAEEYRLRRREQHRAVREAREEEDQWKRQIEHARKQRRAQIKDAKSTGVDQWRVHCMDFLDQLMMLEHAQVFNQPVDPKADGCPDYLKVIKQPLDYGTIWNKLRTGGHTCPQQFSRDCAQVWRNGIKYNKEGRYGNREIIGMAEKVQAFFDKQWPVISLEPCMLDAMRLGAAAGEAPAPASAPAPVTDAPAAAPGQVASSDMDELVAAATGSAGEPQPLNSASSSEGAGSTQEEEYRPSHREKAGEGQAGKNRRPSGAARPSRNVRRSTNGYEAAVAAATAGPAAEGMDWTPLRNLELLAEAAHTEALRLEAAGQVQPPAVRGDVESMDQKPPMPLLAQSLHAPPQVSRVEHERVVAEKAQLSLENQQMRREIAMLRTLLTHKWQAEQPTQAVLAAPPAAPAAAI